MVRCSVLGCKSDSERKIAGLSFHSFPAVPELRNLWIEATKRTSWVPKKSSKICSQHFHGTSFMKIGNKTFLNPKAVPLEVIKSSNPLTFTKPVASTSAIPEIEIKIGENIPTIQHASGIPSIATPSMTQMDIDQSKTTTYQYDSKTNKPLSTSSSAGSTSMIRKTRTMISGVSSKNLMSNKSPEYTPRTLKRKLKKQQETSQERLKKLKALREKSRRLTKKVADLETILADLKTKLLVTSEDCDGWMVKAQDRSLWRALGAAYVQQWTSFG